MKSPKGPNYKLAGQYFIMDPNIMLITLESLESDEN